jgi:predicted Ser/Thr protein kinase
MGPISVLPDGSVRGRWETRVDYPEFIGRYRVLQELGRGGMGVVYLAHDPAIDRRVAIKTISFTGWANRDQQDEAKQRFLREAQAAGRLVHPHIMMVFDVGTFGSENLFIAMEHLHGETMDAFTKRPDLLPEERVVALMAQVCDALDYAHRSQIIHRDIKPDNLMLVDGDRLKITDFGLAKDPTRHADQSTVLGTPSYMSPEQVTGKETDGRSDLFSVGVVVYELLTGTRPFPGETVSTVLYRLIHEEPREPSLINKRLPSAFDHFIRKALHKDPSSRFQTGREMADALRNYRQFGVSQAQAERVGKRADASSFGAEKRKAARRAQVRKPRRGPRARFVVPALLIVGLAVAALATPSYRTEWKRSALPMLRPLLLQAGLGPSVGHTGNGPTLALTADRPGARFFLDGVRIGESLSWGEHLAGKVLSASDGCLRGERILGALLGPDSGPIEVALSDPVIQEVTLRSVPAGARIERDGEPLRGTTPVQVHLQACIDHRVTLTLEGYQPATMSFPAGTDWEVLARETAYLGSIPQGKLAFTSPYRLSIIANGEPVGSSGKSITLPAGSNELTFQNKEHRVRVTRNIEVEAGENREIAAPVPGLGKLQIHTYPGNAEILVDGIPAGAPPLTLKVGAGLHRIECKWKVGARKSTRRRVQVKTGDTETVYFKQRGG